MNMSFTITHSNGRMERNPPIDMLSTLLDELESVDAEHGDVSLTHETEWCLSVSRNGSVYFENLEAGEPCHMRNVPKEKILGMWKCLSRGEIESLQRENWAAGYK